jgi:hypothetical protein
VTIRGLTAAAGLREISCLMPPSFRPSNALLALAGLWCGFLVAGCSEGTGPGSGQRNGRILFSAPRGDPIQQKQELYLMEPDGSDLRRLTMR